MGRLVRVVLLIAFGLLALTACGASSRRAARQTTTAATRTTHSAQQCRRQAAAVAKIDRDLAAMQHASTEATMSTLTDSFLLHVSTAPLTNLQRNRMIDHAAAAVTFKCPQCFQALEAARPIPAIRAGDLKCSS